MQLNQEVCAQGASQQWPTMLVPNWHSCI